MSNPSEINLHGVRVLHLAAADSMLNPNLRDQLIFLRQQGCDVSTASIDGPLARRLRDEDGFDWTPLPLSREFAPIIDLRAVRFIQQFCRQRRFDIVHTHTPKGNLVGQWGAHLAETAAVVQTLHGFYFHDRMNWAKRRAWIEIERFSARHSDHLLCQNPEDVETAIREKIVERERITELGNGLDLDRFSPVSEEVKTSLRAKIGIPPDALVVGMVGRFVAEKGFPVFLEAARILTSQFDDVYFLAIGHRVASERKGDRFTFDSLEIDSALKNRLSVLTNREDMPELYGCMDVSVLPSYREGFPRCLIEGAAMGLPQVATRIRGCRQAIMEGETGYLVEPGDARTLAERITNLVKDPDKRKKFGKTAREFAKTKFDCRSVFRILKTCYAEVLGHIEFS